MEQVPIFRQTKLLNQAQHSGLEGSVAFLEDDHALFQELLSPIDEHKLIRDALRVLSEVSQSVNLCRWRALDAKELFLGAELQQDSSYFLERLFFLLLGALVPLFLELSDEVVLLDSLFCLFGLLFSVTFQLLLL